MRESYSDRYFRPMVTVRSFFWGLLKVGFVAFAAFFVPLFIYVWANQ